VYATVLEGLAAAPASVTFVDDRPDNVDAARRAGFMRCCSRIRRRSTACSPLAGYDTIVVARGLPELRWPPASAKIRHAGAAPGSGKRSPDHPVVPPEIRDAGSMGAVMPGHPNNWAFMGRMNDRVSFAVARGKIVGGSTALNGTYFIRARRADFERWVALGNPAWSFEQVLPFYRAWKTTPTTATLLCTEREDRSPCSGAA